MSESLMRRAIVVSMLLLIALTAVQPVAAAEPPPNDSIATPTVITTFPYTATQDTTAATNEPIDPTYCRLPENGVDLATVWYSWTATEETAGPIGVSTFGSDYDTTLYVGIADGSGGFRVMDCADDSGGGSQSAVRFDALAGETYLFMVGTCCEAFGSDPGGNLVFNLDVGPVAQVYDLTVDLVGSFTRAGTAIVTGTISCTAPADEVNIVLVELTQFVGMNVVQGTGFVLLEGCPDESIPFAVEVTPDDGRFVGGPTSAVIHGTACNLYQCGTESISTRLRLRG